MIGYYWGSGMPMMGYYWGPGISFFGFLLMFLFWAIIIFLIISAVRRSRQFESSMEMDPLQKLKLRYVNGEISKEDFDKMKKTLKDS